MNLEKEIGRLIIAGFQGADVSTASPIITDIRQRNLGGVILFDRFIAERRPSNNIISAEQTAGLIADLQNSAHGNLLVAVDQEGGKVSRFKQERGFPVTPAAAVLAQTRDTMATDAAATTTAAMLAEMGFTLNLAPVVDLNTNPDNPIIGRFQRSFSADPTAVADHARAWISAHHRRGIRCCLKHFPGHGSSRTDSHLGFVDISASWQHCELAPYRRLIAEGMADAVMTGHLYNAHLDSRFCATLSPPTITGLLRGELDFTGPVLSDDLQMRAITERYGIGRAACLALAAGIDVIVVGNNISYDPDIVRHIIASVCEAVANGTLSEERIHQAVRRVESLRQPVGR